MKRIAPTPWLSLFLLGVWLLLNDTLAPGQIVLGTVLALALPWLTAGVRRRDARPGPSRGRRAFVLARLLLRVAGDIVLSSFDVARRVLGPQSALEAGFVWVPLELRDARGISLLMSMVCLTPGTVTADLSADRRHLLIHALHLPDAAAMIADIKQRYEAPLREIFP